MLNESGRRSISTMVFWFVIVLFFMLLAGVIGNERSNAAQNGSRGALTGSAANVADEAAVVEYTLRTRIGENPAMAYVGVGGDIDGVVNPALVVNVGDRVRITVINGDPTLHDLNIDAFNAHTGELVGAEQTATVEFVATQAGMYEYYCSVPGHREVGMKGMLTVTGHDAAGNVVQVSNTTAMGAMASAPAAAPVQAAGPVDPAAAIISRSPADVPPSVGDRGPQTIQVDLETVELNGVLADGTTYRYMTFGGQVPGPMVRVRVDDTVTLVLHNKEDSQLSHSIDLHAVTGPGGGAVYTQVMPGESGSFTFKALAPGVYVYHCATPSVAHHITSGMYGLIVVEPEGGLPSVDREYYIMQGEMYTAQPFGTPGQLDFSYQAMLDEQPQYYVFNGAAGALTQDAFALQATVGETVRIYFGVGGPNAISSFHVIGEILDRVYDLASLTSPPMTNVQTTLVPPGGATMVEFKVEVPGRYILVDHALSRLERGLAGYLYVEGDDNPEIFFSEEAPDGSGH